LTKRLNNDAEADDLLAFLGARLRKYRLMGQIRKVVNRDAEFWPLFDEWERRRMDINNTPPQDQAAKAKRLLADVKKKMTNGRMSPASVDQVMDLWERLARNRDRMTATGAGQLIIGFENQVRAGDLETRNLLRAVVRAADWTIVTKKENTTLSVGAFRKGWSQCVAYKKARVARRD
ncbi:MAG: hypothetical protein N2C14_29945, partial [Planctomycetales bacterium]